MRSTAKRICGTAVAGVLLAVGVTAAVGLPAHATGNTPAGSFDSSFNTDIPNDRITLTPIGIQPDGKSLVFRKDDGWGSEGQIVRINLDGSVDDNFVAPTVSGDRAMTVGAIAVNADGSILLGGGFTSVNDGTEHDANAVARLHEDGSFDDTFHSPLASGHSVNSIAVDGDGHLLLGGAFTAAGPGATANGVLRINLDGSLDESFPRPPVVGKNGIYTELIGLYDDGRVLFHAHPGIKKAVYSDAAGEHPFSSLARLNADGSFDTTFTSEAKGPTGGAVLDAAIVGDQAVIVGSFTGYDDGDKHDLWGVARINSDGSVDTSFNPGRDYPDDRAVEITQGHDGKFYLTGPFYTYGGREVGQIARMNVDGSFDPTFNPNGTGISGPTLDYGSRISALVFQPDGKLLIGGRFDRYNDGTDHKTSSILIRVTTANPPKLNDVAFPDAEVGAEYTATISANGTGPISYRITAGTLPYGLTLAEEGTLSGTPVTNHTFTFEVTATNSQGADSRTYTLNTFKVAPELVDTIPDGQTAAPYQAEVLKAGSKPVAFTISAGELPDGITLDKWTGTLAGTPTTEGTYIFTITATGYGTAAHEYTLSINPAQ